MGFQTEDPGAATVTRAVVLLSGGLDSATCLGIARDEGCECHALTVSYGQRHAVEVSAARAVAMDLRAASHKVIQIDLRAFGGSALTDDRFEVPKSGASASPGADIPITYVPARNTIFLAYALGYAEVLDASRIYVGVNAVDYSGYPDCRPEFIEAFQRLADLATRAGVEGHGPRVLAPLISMKKTEIIRRGLAAGVNYGLTHSCYDPPRHAGGGEPDWGACGRCESCRIRAEAFGELGMSDPALRRA